MRPPNPPRPSPQWRGAGADGIRLVVSWLIALALLTWGPHLRAEGRRGGAALGFAKLVLRIERSGGVYVDNDYRPQILDALRHLGFNAVGAENVALGRDRSRHAEMLLGGTVVELRCLDDLEASTRSCRIGVRWEVLDLARDAVVYRVLTRFAVIGQRRNRRDMGERLVLGAVRSLGERTGFERVLSAKGTKPSDAHFEAATFEVCRRADVALPAAMETVLAASVVVSAGDSIGSGFLLNGDGLVLTAAHVVEHGPVTVKLRDGSVRRAQRIRVAKRHDAALLATRLGEPGNDADVCLPLAEEEAVAGADVWAVGSPVSEELAFSVSRGVVSGVRLIKGREFLQTDAAVSPGNSGGPMVDVRGRVLGLVTWKATGQAVEGLAFAVPIQNALEALALEAGRRTDESLSEPATDEPEQAPAGTFEDDADPMPSLTTTDRSDADADQNAEPKHQGAATPVHLRVLRWGGLATASLGFIAAVASSAAYDRNTSTKAEFEHLRLENDLSWLAVVLGGAAFGVSYAIEPKATRRDTDVARSPPRGAAVSLTTSGLRVSGSF